jgi:phage I-like protein
MQSSQGYIALQQGVPGKCFRAYLKERKMTNPLSQAQTQTDRVNDLVAEVFQAATIVLAGVLGILTVAATI